MGHLFEQRPNDLNEVLFPQRLEIQARAKCLKFVGDSIIDQIIASVTTATGTAPRWAAERMRRAAQCHRYPASAIALPGRRQSEPWRHLRATALPEVLFGNVPIPPAISDGEAGRGGDYAPFNGNPAGRQVTPAGAP